MTSKKQKEILDRLKFLRQMTIQNDSDRILGIVYAEEYVDKKAMIYNELEALEAEVTKLLNKKPKEKKKLAVD